MICITARIQVTEAQRIPRGLEGSLSGARQVARAVLAAVATFIVFVGGTTRAADPDEWARILIDADAFANSPGTVFSVGYIRYTRDVFSVPLAAFCWYRYRVGTDPVILHGKKRSNDTFQPIVSYEVATEGKTKWKKIPADFDQPGTETLIVSPDKPVAKLWVNMDPFQKAVGIFRFGRLVLENGDSAIFEIDDLLPTEDARGETRDYKQVVFESDEEKKEKGFPESWLPTSAELFSVVSLGERLIGDFIFEIRPPRETSLEGTRTLDGDFWPEATLQVANSDRIWKTIGKSQNQGKKAKLEISSGKAERVRVLLRKFRPLVRKYKYGRVLFSNGESGIFLLEQLNPDR